MVKIGDYILLSDEIRLADFILKVICVPDEECLIDYIKDDRVGFKLTRWGRGAGWCNLQQAEDMHRAWIERDVPASRGRASEESD